MPVRMEGEVLDVEAAPSGRRPMTTEGPQHFAIGSGDVHYGSSGRGQQLIVRMPRDGVVHPIVEACKDLAGRGVPYGRPGGLALAEQLAVPRFLGGDAPAIGGHRQSLQGDLTLLARAFRGDEREGEGGAAVQLVLPLKALARRGRAAGAQNPGPGKQPGAQDRPSRQIGHGSLTGTPASRCASCRHLDDPLISTSPLSPVGPVETVSSHGNEDDRSAPWA